VREVGEVPRIECVSLAADELVRITGGVDEVVVLFELAEDRVHLCGLLGNEKHGDCRHDSMTSASPGKRLRRNRCRHDRYQDSECSSPHARPPLASEIQPEPYTRVRNRTIASATQARKGSRCIGCWDCYAR